ncbi:phospholipase D-like domain-containing protein [Rufibacter psychrotolerans]|uniref:phospholipase D-like domain-containing protein n=1 Tax=Rufibacter psychrotolerans TaxID=2812556 RepID=UPI001967C633|nr:phospholipase D-like domain-containing protein [Rufibacter sp. SYSU D00308]
MAFRLPFFSSPAKLACGAYFSPGEACLQAILQSIQAATSSLKICVFTISDDRITRAILAAHAKGISIQLVTDNEKLYDKGSDIRQLAQAGVQVKVDASSNHMHHKFAIIDHHYVLTGSYNWTRSAALYNHENVLVTADRQVVRGYTTEFNQLWEKMVWFTQA